MYSLALTLANSYVPFTDIGAAVMKMMADAESIETDDASKQELKEKFSTMPPYPEVPVARCYCAEPERCVARLDRSRRPGGTTLSRDTGADRALESY
jgi:hypothetical protein